MSTRVAQITLKSVDGAGDYNPDTGETVYLKSLDGTTVSLTASETPSGGGQYQATITETPCMGRWWHAASELTQLGMVWLGKQGQPRQTFIFRKVEVYDPADSPSGAKNAPKIFITGGAALSDSAYAGTGKYSDNFLAPTLDGSTTNAFTKVPLVMLCSNYQERTAFIATDPSLSTGNVTFAVSVGDNGENYSDGKCYCDILIMSLD